MNNNCGEESEITVISSLEPLKGRLKDYYGANSVMAAYHHMGTDVQCSPQTVRRWFSAPHNTSHSLPPLHNGVWQIVDGLLAMEPAIKLNIREMYPDIPFDSLIAHCSPQIKVESN